MQKERLTAERKALLINLEEKIYGTFAEIGGGQEVGRLFFRVGGAAGTIAKTMSAYDMKFSDEIYGRVKRYVSKERLVTMLDHEYQLLVERLDDQRGARSNFFVFANSAALRSYRGKNECNAWCGVRFQLFPRAPYNDIYIHARFLDETNVLQQQALGILGTNLLYGAFFQPYDLDSLVEGLVDDLSASRIEVDMLELHGPNFSGVDNRLMSLKLVEKGLSPAVMFGPNRDVLQPSEWLYKKCVLVERGSFRPVTYVNTDMFDRAQDRFQADPDVGKKTVVKVAEMTMKNLTAEGKLDPGDFLQRADSLSALGYTVMISSFPEFWRVTSYIRRYTNEKLAMVVSANTLTQIFDEKFYADLCGGVMEALGRLFHQKVCLYVYPMAAKIFRAYAAGQEICVELPEDDDIVISASKLRFKGGLQNLYDFLLSRDLIQPIEGKPEYFGIYSRDLWRQVRSGDPAWKKLVPPEAHDVVRRIEERSKRDTAAREAQG